MSPARFLTAAILAAACAGALALGATDSNSTNRSTGTATGLASITLSRAEVGNAIALAGFVAIFCSHHGDCTR